MPVYSDATCTIFFGTKEFAIDPATVRSKTYSQVADQAPFITYQQVLGLQQLVLLHQTHGIDGVYVSDASKEMKFFTQDGDYLITTTPGLGIGVATADCLSIVMIASDPTVGVVIHAGWKGLMSGIVQHVLQRMQIEFQVDVSSLKVFVGPAAGGCCYEVGQDFIDANGDKKGFQKALSINDNCYKFDAKAFLLSSLLDNGIVESAIDTTYSVCTICEPLHCSYRREKKSPLRQLTLLSLK